MAVGCKHSPHVLRVICGSGSAARYALGVLGLGSLLLTQVRYEHPASIKDAEAQELATREAADMRRADSASAQLIKDGLDGCPQTRLASTEDKTSSSHTLTGRIW